MVARSLLYFHADKSCVSFRRIVVMSAELESMYLAFQNNQVPGVWTRVAYPCLKPLASWMKDFHRRIEFFNKWCTVGQPNCFWLPGFYYPQGFMTGALQTHARRYHVPKFCICYVSRRLGISMF
jgi:dynein heavy chain